MKRTIGGLLALLACATVIAAVADAQVAYLDDEQITVAASSIGFTATKITPVGGPMANLAVCRVETAEIRYRLNGLAPTSSVGTLLEIGDQVVVSGHDLLLTFRAIRTGSTSGQLDCTYYAR